MGFRSRAFGEKPKKGTGMIKKCERSKRLSNERTVNPTGFIAIACLVTAL
jgi:hypothetical protein